MKNNSILIAYGEEIFALAEEILTEADLAKMIPDPSCLIGIKPNLVAPVPASEGGTTHPEIVEALIRYLKKNGFHNLVVMEGSWVGDLTSDAYEECGYREICERYEVPFVDMQKEKAVCVEAGGMELHVGAFALKPDFLINVPVLKGHCQTRITCAMKNLKGLLPNTEKRKFHRLGLHEPIARLNLAIASDFILVDSICGDLSFEDGGNPILQNRILAGRDPVLMDSVCCSFLGVEPEEVEYIVLGEKLGAGSRDVSKAEIRILHPEKQTVPVFDKRKVFRLSEMTEEVESCSACYGYLIPALDLLEQEGLLLHLKEKIAIGQGYRGQNGILGVGNCTRNFEHHCPGCPPTENQMYAFLKEYILTEKR